jgi:hypothetical protein
MGYGFGAIVPKVFHKAFWVMLANRYLRGDTGACELLRSSVNKYLDHHY